MLFRELNIGRRVGGLALAAAMFVPGLAAADNEASQSATLEVTAINEIEVSGNPAALTVDTAVAGSEPTDATDNSTTYAITTNAGTNAKKITGQIDTALPLSTVLSVSLEAPSGGSTSTGSTALNEATAADLVTGVEAVVASDLAIGYTFSATVAAGVVASTGRTVTFTLTDS